MILENIIRKNLIDHFRISDATGSDIVFDTLWADEWQTLYLKHHGRNVCMEFRFTAVLDYIIVYGKTLAQEKTTLTIDYGAPLLCMSFVLGQQAVFPDGGVILPLQHNVAYFPEQHFRVGLEKGRSYEFVFVRLKVTSLKEWPEDGAFVGFQEKVLRGEQAVLCSEHLLISPRMLRLVHDLIHPDKSLPYAALLHLRCTQLVVMMLEQVCEEIARPVERPDVETVRKVQALRAFMLENISKKISRAMLLREVGSGPKKIQDGFRMLYGKSMFEVLHEERMEHAWKWIRQGQLSIGNVSEALGYKTQKHFSKIFKSYFGIKPSEHRVRGSYGAHYAA